MNSLAEKEHLKGQVQMIYFDPPYGIKFSSNWQVSTRKRDVSDTKVEDVTPQPEQVKAFRDTWELGIHSYLTYVSATAQDYITHILEHLKTGGVQNCLQEQRITFDWLEEHPGEWLHAEAVHTDTNGTAQSTAISIGPQYDTVGRQWIEAAAKEAMRRIPKFDMLIVTGFAFEGYTADEETRMGPLTILPVKVSPELMVRELKNTGEGNLFMVFGEPDVEIERHQDDMVSLKLLGVDVYDPRKGLVHSNTPDDIACWFIDTAYNGEAFFVRHAYFTGADEPYKQLQRALNSEIDAEMWEALYRKESLPFAKPETGKIAVKVINHYGDEVMKEYRIL